eukprot:910538-Pyramimonas_sp.AAC.1
MPRLLWMGSWFLEVSRTSERVTYFGNMRLIGFFSLPSAQAPERGPPGPLSLNQNSSTGKRVQGFWARLHRQLEGP